MAGSLIEVNDANGGSDISLTFKRESFRDFLDSLISTPMEERRYYEAGFDLAKGDIKNLVDKLHYHISTTNVLVNHEFLCTIYFDGNRTLTLRTPEQFFNVSQVGPETVRGIDLTLSYVVGFNRGGNLHYEKQVISATFVAGPRGSLRLGVRSTEFTWPNSIIQLIEYEFLNLAERTAGSSLGPGSRLLFLAPYLEDVWRPARNIVKERIFERPTLYRFFVYSMMVSIIPMFLLLFSMMQPYIVEDGFLVKADPSEVIDRLGAVDGAEALSLGKTLHMFGALPYRDGYWDSYFSFPASYVKYVLTIGIIVGVFVYSNYRGARNVSLARIGRIFLSTSPTTPRPQQKPGDGAIMSFVIGAIASLFVVLLVSVINGFGAFL